MQKAERVKYYDVVKGIGIFLVVISHFMQISKMPCVGLITIVINSFHMPLFFIISGMLFKQCDFIEFIARKSKLLIYGGGIRFCF